MTIDPWEIGTALVLVVLMVAGIEIGLAFLMRSQREAANPDD